MGATLRELAQGDREAILTAVEHEIPWNDISKVLRMFGHKIIGQTISRHFNGICSCDDVQVRMKAIDGAASIEDAVGAILRASS